LEWVDGTDNIARNESVAGGASNLVALSNGFSLLVNNNIRGSIGIRITGGGVWVDSNRNLTGDWSSSNITPLEDVCSLVAFVGAVTSGELVGDVGTLAEVGVGKDLGLTLVIRRRSSAVEHQGGISLRSINELEKAISVSGEGLNTARGNDDSGVGARTTAIVVEPILCHIK